MKSNKNVILVYVALSLLVEPMKRAWKMEMNLS